MRGDHRQNRAEGLFVRFGIGEQSRDRVSECQPTLSPFPLGQVGEQDHRLFDGFIGPTQRRDGHRDFESLPALRLHLCFDVGRRLAGEGSLQRSVEDVTFGAAGDRQRTADGFGGGATQEAFRRWVPAGDDSFAVDRADGGGRKADERVVDPLGIGQEFVLPQEAEGRSDFDTRLFERKGVDVPNRASKAGGDDCNHAILKDNRIQQNARDSATSDNLFEHILGSHVAGAHKGTGRFFVAHRPHFVDQQLEERQRLAGLWVLRGRPEHGIGPPLVDRPNADLERLERFGQDIGPGLEDRDWRKRPGKRSPDFRPQRRDVGPAFRSLFFLFALRNVKSDGVEAAVPVAADLPAEPFVRAVVAAERAR